MNDVTSSVTATTSYPQVVLFLLPRGFLDIQPDAYLARRFMDIDADPFRNCTRESGQRSCQTDRCSVTVWSWPNQESFRLTIWFESIVTENPDDWSSFDEMSSPGSSRSPPST